MLLTVLVSFAAGNDRAVAQQLPQTCAQVAAGNITETVATQFFAGTSSTHTVQLSAGDQLTFSTQFTPGSANGQALVELQSAPAGVTAPQTLIMLGTPPGGPVMFTAPVAGVYVFRYFVQFNDEVGEASVRFIATANCVQQTGSITINKVTTGGDGTFTFTSDNMAFTPVSLTTVGGSATTGAITLPPGNYLVSEEAAPGFNLTELQCVDPDNGTTVNPGRGEASIDLDAGEAITCTFTNAAQGSIIINKITSGGDGTFTYSSPDPTLNAVSLTTVNGNASSGAIVKQPGTFTITENMTGGFAPIDLACVDPDNGSSTDLASRTATIDLDAGETVICTFTNLNARGQTQNIIEAFLHQRAKLLLSDEPDRARRIRRLLGSLWGDTGGTNGGRAAAFAQSPMSFRRGSVEAGGTQYTFSTSLSQIGQFMAQSEAKRVNELGPMAFGSGSVRTPAATQGTFDVWFEGHYTEFDNDLVGANRDGHLGVAYFGADYLLRPGLLVGALVQLDWSEDQSKTLGWSVDGDGWMAGPYMTAQLAPNLFFDARAVWGQSDNDINPFGMFTDSFDTDRWLATARLTGNWRRGNFRMTPSVAVKYIDEDQKSYVDSFGILIPSQNVSLGRLTFGPEFAYRHITERGASIEPHVKIEGNWDFDSTGQLVIGNTVVGTEDFSAKVEGGVLVQMPGGVSFRATGSYDGIGDEDFDAYGAQLWLNVPIDHGR